MAIDTSRREFIQNSTTAAATLFTTNIFTGNILGANDRITLAIIGVGGMGGVHMRNLVKRNDLEIVTACDVYPEESKRRVAEALTNEKAPQEVRERIAQIPYETDFRNVLRRADIDAVLVATPDHWHPYITIEACKAGKDVYVEKPVSHNIREGRLMVEAARKYRRIVQVGTQQRSDGVFKNAVRIARSRSVFDTVVAVRAWINGDHPLGCVADAAPPQGLDWDMWLGPAPHHAYNENRFHPSFRRYWDYAGGSMTDWGVHLLDIVLWAMNVKGPTQISAVGNLLWLQDCGQTPTNLVATFLLPEGDFPESVCVFEHLAVSGMQTYSRALDGRGREHGVLFIGSNGNKLFVNRFDWEVIPAENQKLPASITVEENGQKLEVPLEGGYEQWNYNPKDGSHHDQFFRAMRSRELPNSDMQIGHRSTVMCHLGNVAYRTGETIRWDPETERLTKGSAEAHKLLTRAYRKPWKLDV